MESATASPATITTTETSISRWREGVQATVPLWPGALLFGIVYAVTGRAAGLSPAQIVVMSLVVHAGASQFAAVNLIAAGAGPVSVIIATAITNLRHVLMGGSVAPHVAHRSRGWRALYAYHLSDESYGLATARFLAGDGTPAYALGTNMGMIVPWVGGAIIGLVVGGVLPNAHRWGVDLVGPLIFLALLVPLLGSRRTVGVAVVSSIFALVGVAVLPGAWYLLLAGIGGSAVGALWEQWGERRGATRQ